LIILLLLGVQFNPTFADQSLVMTSSLAKYHARSPRYVLQPEDNTLIRVAGPKQTPWEETTDIRNISLTGLVFTAANDLCPSIGEILKIEYSVPGGQKLAGYAMVTRLEAFSSSKMLVGVKFHQMDLPQRVHLAQALTLKLREQQLHRLEVRQKKLTWLKRRLPVLFLVMWGLLFYELSCWYLTHSMF
jgi:hypothetical protein